MNGQVLDKELPEPTFIFNPPGEKTQTRALKAIRLISWVTPVAWTVLVAGLLILSLNVLNNQTIENARQEARTAFEKDVIYRSWNAMYGPVYMPVSPVIQPNPYLANLKGRDITLPDGRVLTQVNPAYMSRIIFALTQKDISIIGHITSLDLVNPGNKPDAWEMQALHKLEAGATEASQIEIVNGKEYLRLIRPLYVESSCLQCHEQQGYHVGDVRGGISEAIPLAPLRQEAQKPLLAMVVGYLSVWGVGLAGILVVGVTLKKTALERDAVWHQLELQATHDPLTHLPNRALFNQYLTLAIHHSQRTGEKFFVLFLDLDFFKRVNDEFGHTKGDLVLVEAAERLRRALRKSDMVARMGGDEFLAAVIGIKEKSDIIIPIQKIMDEISDPVFVLDGKELHITASIGASYYPDDGTEVETLIHKADVAMYSAKQMGRNDYAIYGDDGYL